MSKKKKSIITAFVVFALLVAYGLFNQFTGRRPTS